VCLAGDVAGCLSLVAASDVIPTEVRSFAATSWAESYKFKRKPDNSIDKYKGQISAAEDLGSGARVCGYLPSGIGGKEGLCLTIGIQTWLYTCISLHSGATFEKVAEWTAGVGAARLAVPIASVSSPTHSQPSVWQSSPLHSYVPPSQIQNPYRLRNRHLFYHRFHYLEVQNQLRKGADELKFQD